MMTATVFGDISLNVSADAVAWYGAILASLTSLKVVNDFWNDRSRVKIEWLFNMTMSGETKDYFLIKVINKGRRPVKITHVATKQYGKKEVGLLGHSFTNEETRILTEERPATDYPVVQGDISEESLWYVVVYDARGKEYRKYNPISTPMYKRIYWHIIKPKNNKKLDRK